MTAHIPNDAHAMIIGAMKCGTSSLYAYLKGHPQICPSQAKEPEYFSENQKHGTKAASYSELFEFDASVHRYTLEASTGYTKYPTEPNVAKNIFEYGLKPKLIYIVRNPFDRIESHFSYMTQRDDSWMLDVNSEHLISTSNYHLQLEQYRRHFPREDILLLDFDDLKQDPEGLLRRVYRFLDLPDIHFPETYQVVNAARNPVAAGVVKGLRQSWIAPALDWIPGPLKKLGKLALGRVMPPKRRTLTTEEREFIRTRLAADVARLETTYGFNTGRWGF